MVKRNASEVVREAARLNEVLVQLRLERGKLMREEVLLREKVGTGLEAERRKHDVHCELWKDHTSQE